ncbi:MAG: Smr/MutS family protein [Fimbriimonadaceae bacterium]|nr:Smr/MutS family protein [Alphaproteobacteria bacterium]
MSEPPGVLRRNIRHWLEQAEFRTLVAAYAQAHRRHGGDGAIYIQLRRNRSNPA